MYPSLEFYQKTYSNACYRSACLVQKDLVRAMIQTPDEAFTLCSSPNRKPPTLLCFKNLGTYGLEQRFLHGNVTTLWLTQIFSHRASSN